MTVGFRISLSQSASLQTRKAPRASSKEIADRGYSTEAPAASHFRRRAKSASGRARTRAAG
eukprot:396704-Lingulodinium_polyedra.AAC.1